ncbi:hypothetical protein D3C76_1273400 [compost metagenome]
MAHYFKQAIECCRFPVSFASKAISLCHQTLDSKTWKLLHPVQVFEVCCEGIISATFEETFQGNFVAGLYFYASFPVFLAVSSVIEFIKFCVFIE